MTVFQRLLEANKPQDLGLLFVKNLFSDPFLIFFFHPWHFEIGFSKSHIV